MTKMNWNYIAGFFDGEGCIYKYKNRDKVDIILTNNEIKLLEVIQKFLLEKKIKSYIYKKTNRNCYDLRIVEQDSVKMFLLAIKNKCFIKGV